MVRDRRLKGTARGVIVARRIGGGEPLGRATTAGVTHGWGGGHRRHHGVASFRYAADSPVVRRREEIFGPAENWANRMKE